MIIKLHRIVEKIVWLAAFVTVSIGAICMIYEDYNDIDDDIGHHIYLLLPYLYIAGMIYCAFYMIICGVRMYLEIKIRENNARLKAILREQRSQLNLERKKLQQEYEQKETQIRSSYLSVEALIKRQEKLDRIREAIQQAEKADREARLQNTEEYTTLFFSLAKSSVEDVENVLEITKLFLESGHILADKNFKISLNKNIRNAELKQWASNIVKYNHKENLDIDNYLMNVFGEWFTGKKENI